MRATKDGDGQSMELGDACAGGVLCRSANHSRRRGLARAKGMELPDALKLLDQRDLKGKVVAGDAMFWQKSIVAKIAEKGGGYLLPVKDNRKNLRENIETAFQTGLQRAGFSPSSRLRALSKRRMGASNGARSTCFQRKPPASSKTGRA